MFFRPFFILCLILSPLIGVAEDSHSELTLDNIKFMPTVGLTYSRLNYDKQYEDTNGPNFDNSSIISFSVGFLAEYAMNNFAVQTGLVYSNFKSDVSGNVSDGLLPPDSADVSFEHSLSYLQIPVKIKYYLMTTSNSFFVIGGLSPSLLINAEREFESTNTSLIYKNTNFKKELNSFDIIASLGFGYKYYHNSLGYLVSLNYDHGLINVSDEKPKSDAYNSNFNVKFGISF